MKLIKWTLIFIIAFIISLIMILTFSQEVFKQTASARIVGYVTPEIPVYYYIAGAFGLGLLVGLGVALYTFISGTAESLKKSRRIRELEKSVKEQEAWKPSEQTAVQKQLLAEERLAENSDMSGIEP